MSDVAVTSGRDLRDTALPDGELHARLSRTWGTGKGLIARLSTVDHKIIGRRYLGAGALPMSRGNLAAWIVDPHGIKPGVNMPTIKLPASELNAMSAYLESLK